MSTAYYLEALRRIADEMDRTRASPDAVVGYDVSADALVWADEYPSRPRGGLRQFDCVKLLLRYRTTLLLGDPDESFKPYWDLGIELFPNWAGFSPTRVNPTDELRELYEYHRKRGLRHMHLVDVLCDRPRDRDSESRRPE